MKEFSSKCIVLKIDAIGPENILFASSSVHHSAWKEILQAGAVKGLISGCGGFIHSLCPRECESMDSIRKFSNLASA